MASPNYAALEQEILFATLGMFIIDDIHPLPPQPPQLNIIGGAGTYSALGARLFWPPPNSWRIGWIVDEGDDFPSEVREEVDKWQTGCRFRKRKGLTTRGWNGYTEEGIREFRYTTPKLRLDASDLSPDLLASRSFHFICSSERCISMTQNILSSRSTSFDVPPPRPILIWEPVPDLCVPSELETCKRACKTVDVISPNDSELLSFFERAKVYGEDRWRAVERCAEELLRDGVGVEGKGSVIVRAGKEGCYVATLDLNSKVGSKWLPAYHKDASRVLDPTGGGNAFLGGFAVGLLGTREKDELKKLVEAAAYGSVAASLCIEQVGVPKREKGWQESETRWQTGDTGWQEVETWNGIDVKQRLKEFKSMIVGN
ncbi:Ribokinase-like protein [Viridothelium virens]|uniref:Ribokinase-like protein n=1 Tax=Viridothelium virens TaxID=1048519 RepID=A0A6A6GZV6_VIRVR|nr:Ribokinase-like protein [Viridothelium virens]